MEDSKIVELYWKRDDNAISESDKKYGAYCFAISNNILHNSEDSEECVSDTWFNAWNAIPPKKPERLKMFFAKITRNLSFNRYTAAAAKKRGGSEMELVLDELAECLADDKNVESEFRHRLLERSINRFVKDLPEREQNIFLRRYFFAENTSMIAKNYKLSANNVMVILSRVRKKLKLYLAKEGYFNE